MTDEDAAWVLGHLVSPIIWFNKISGLCVSSAPCGDFCYISGSVFAYFFEDNYDAIYD